MDDDLITLDEAYRELIRAKDLELVAQATSLKEVHCLQLSGTEWEKTREWKEHSAKILLNCAEQLRAAIRTGKLPLRGYPATGVDQIDIGQTDREVGELDFWKGTLSRDGRLIFTHVRCSRADVRRLLIPPAPVPSSKGGRPSDKGLIVNEARRRLDAGQGADSLRAFAQRLHEWLDKKPEARRAAKRKGNAPEYDRGARQGYVERAPRKNLIRFFTRFSALVYSLSAAPQIASPKQREANRGSASDESWHCRLLEIGRNKPKRERKRPPRSCPRPHRAPTTSTTTRFRFEGVHGRPRSRN